MPEYAAGDAKLRLIPDASQFKERTEAELAKIKADFKVRLDADLTQARSDVDRFRTEQQRNAVNVDIDPNLKEASAQMAAWRAAQRANPVNVPVDIDHKGAMGGAASAGKKYGEEFAAAMGSALKVNFASAGFALIPGAVTAVASLTQALEQLSMAALVVPGALAGIGSSLGTLLLGVSGIGEAWKAVEKASEDATTNVAANARTAAQAATTYRNAVVDEATAQKDLAQARRDSMNSLKDLNLEMRGGALSEKEALNALAAARRDLSTGRFKDAIDAEAAQLRVQEAEQRVLDVRQRNAELQEKVNDANAKGVENSDAVVAAKEREVRTNQQVASSQQALNDANSAGSKTADAAAAAMAKLSPQAAQFVQTMVNLKPVFVDLRNTVSGNIFQGISGPISQLVTTLIPHLKTGLGGIGTAWNDTIKKLITSVGSTGSVGLMDRILGNTAESQKRLNTAIEPLVRAMGVLSAAGSDSLPRLADGIAAVSNRFAEFIEKADANGNLHKWIEDGMTGFTHLGDILINIGKSFHAITEAAGPSTLLNTLDRLTEKMATFLGSAKGQSELKDFFEKGHQTLDQWRPIVTDLVKSLPAMFDGAYAASGIFMPVLREFADIMAKNPELVRLVTEAFIVWKTVTPIIEAVRIATVGINAALALMPAKAATAGAAMSAVGTTAGTGFAGKFAAGLKGFGWAALGAFIGIEVAVAAGEEMHKEFKEAEDNLFRDWRTRHPANTTPPWYGNTPPVGAPGSNTPLPAGQASPWAPNSSAAQSAQVRDRINKGEIPGYSIDPNGQVVGPDPAMVATLQTLIDPSAPGAQAPKPFIGPKPFGHQTGGPTKAGLAVLHDDEFVQQGSAVDKYGLPFMHAVNQGKIDPNMLPHFGGGGEFGPADKQGQQQGGGWIPTLIGGAGQAVSQAANTGIGLAQQMFSQAKSGQLGGTLGPIFGGMGGQYDPSAGDYYSGINPAAGQRVLPPATPLSTPVNMPDTTSASGPGPDEIAWRAQHGFDTGGQPISITIPGLNIPISIPTGTGPAPGPTDTSTGGFNLAKVPGLWGLAGSLASPNPEQALGAWGSQTAQWLGNFAVNTGTSFLTTLWKGALGMVGLENSILSPDNLYTQSAMKTLGFFGDLSGTGTQDQVVGTYGADGSTTSLPDAPHGGNIAYSPQGVAPGPAAPGTKPGENGLLPVTQAGLSALNARFPGHTIGGYRVDPAFPNEHPAGKALDFMLQGGVAEGQADLPYALSLPGVSYVIFNNKMWYPDGSVKPYTGDNPHTDHLHLHFEPGADTGQPAAAPLTASQAWGGSAPTGPTGGRGPGGQGQGLVMYSKSRGYYLLPSSFDGGGGAPQSPMIGPGGGPPAAAAGDPKSIVHAAMLAAGYSESEWPALQNLLMGESGFRPTAQNPGSTAHGVFQFLDTTWATVGGTKTDDPVLQAKYGLAYIKQRYGTPSKAWDFWQKQSPHWYDTGGILPPGVSIAVNNTGANEDVAIIPSLASGGQPWFLPPLANVAPPPPGPIPNKADQMSAPPPVKAIGPSPSGADQRAAPPAPALNRADEMAAPPSMGAKAEGPPMAAPTPAPGTPGAPIGPVEAHPAPIAGQPPRPEQQGQGPQPFAPTVESTQHNLPALTTGITSGASAIGQALSTAIGVAASAGGGFAPGAGAIGAIGPYVAGLVQQGGKIVEGAANVVSSFLVGNVNSPGEYGAYGQTYRPPPPVSRTAASNSQVTNYNGGIVVSDPQALRRELDLRDAQHFQSAMANRI